MHIFLLCGACVCVCISVSYINAHIYCISRVYTLSFYVLYVLKTLGQRRVSLPHSLSQVLLGAIMAVMKPHLSPSQHNLIIHNETAAVWNEDECALFKGRSYMCVRSKKMDV